MFKLHILSKPKMIEMVQYYAEPFAIISITCPDDPVIAFTDNPFLLSVFRMQFFDTDKDKLGIPAPKQEDFAGLKNYIDQLVQTNCRTLFVHCGGGISRSSAVAAAISDYLHLGYDIFSDRKYKPNMLVYRLTSNELNTNIGNLFESVLFNTD